MSLFTKTFTGWRKATARTAPGILLGVLLGAMALAARPAMAEPPTVFAAASLTDAMTAAGRAYEERTGTEIRFSFASSSTLARQIEAGAPADLYASANEKWMDRLETRGLILPGTRTSPIANGLVLIAPETGAPPKDETIDNLPALLGAQGRLAMGDPAHVPAGIYGKEALEHLGLWKTLEPRLAAADNVRAALALVERGEAPYGIVYATDARIAKVRVVAAFPDKSHTPVTYPFALVKGGDNDEAKDFLSFLTSDDGLAIFERFGFRRN
ncbi:molybdate transport system substrate-binding protein [Parvibaculum indicum]|uniref:molybdate ABC transporter substrate-binding protein n=1 Tax=Parvibaculum indicum TaxID=562969 RepID=UPI0031B6148C|nr:molybdate transport system substrate-binding protein [Parvibaculum indicum]